MSPQLRAILQEALATRGATPTLFVAESQEPWTPGAFGAAFRRACKCAGIDGLGPHVLRHTFASRLVMAGVDLRTVQELMGHKTISMTLRYSHLSPDHKRVAMETLERRFPAKSPADFHNTPLVASSCTNKKVVAIR